MTTTTAPAASAASAAQGNYGLKDEIRAYWSVRAETFDQSHGHKIRSTSELDGWKALFAKHWQAVPDARVLELASGTGEITRVLLAMGCMVDAIDLCEPMISRAQAKHQGAPVRFHLGDAENTMMPDATYDAAICRHLVWTLVEPKAAFADWLRVLKPGGTLIVVDGDWVGRSRRSMLLGRLSAWFDRLAGTPKMRDEAVHQKIMRGVYFREGLKAEALSQMLVAAGFGEIAVGPIASIRRRQFATASWSERLRLLAAYDQGFILSARKPS